MFKLGKKIASGSSLLYEEMDLLGPLFFLLLLLLTCNKGLDQIQVVMSLVPLMRDSGINKTGNRGSLHYVSESTRLFVNVGRREGSEPLWIRACLGAKRTRELSVRLVTLTETETEASVFRK